MKWAKTLLCAECVDLFNFLKWFITEHGLYIALFLILIAYLIRENRKKDEELLRAKDDEIQRLSSFKKHLLKVILDKFGVDMLTSENKEEKDK